MSYLVLDTDVASRSIKHQLTTPLAAELAGQIWCVTFITVGELWRWAATAGWSATSRARLDHWLAQTVVIDSDAAIARTWGDMSARATRRGRPRPANDSWIAACCITLDLPLATMNVKDFTDYADHEGLRLITP